MPPVETPSSAEAPPRSEPAAPHSPQARPGPAALEGASDAAPSQSPLSYLSSGVDRLAAAQCKAALPALAALTSRRGVLGEIGGFGGLFEVPTGLRRPVLVAGSDGVGTKLRLAIETGRHATVGIDLVAMCVNDVLCSGAEPLFFLDYFAAGRLEPRIVQAVLAGVAEGCRRADCALLGGETAELPGFFQNGDYDLAGFAVGVVEAEAIVDGTGVRPGQLVLGLASSGLHANGFALARAALLDRLGLPLLGPSIGGQHSDLADELLEPTLLYTSAVRALCKAVSVKALAHITGGGLTGNLVRVLPEGCRAALRRGSWPEPLLLRAIAEAGVAPGEIAATFNLGIGMAVILEPSELDAARRSLDLAGFTHYLLGEIEEGPRSCVWA